MVKMYKNENVSKKSTLYSYRNAQYFCYVNYTVLSCYILSLTRRQLNGDSG